MRGDVSILNAASMAIPSGLRIVQLSSSRRDLDRFWRVTLESSGREPACVVPLRDEVVKVLSEANPFWSHAQKCLWIAEKNGHPIGRIAGIVDRNHQAVHRDRRGFWGFFECPDDPAVAGALFDAVMAWARGLGCEGLRGPMNPNINEECGLLVSGFERPNAVMMPYAPPWHARLVEAVGFTKARDLVGFHIALADCPVERLDRFRADAGRRAKDVVLVPVTRGNLAARLPALKDIYNSAWERNWSAVPMTAPEIDFLADRLKPLLVDGLVWLAEAAGRPAGLLLAVPDVNEALGPLRGRLFQPAFFRALPFLLGWRRPRQFRLVALGVRAGQRGRGIEGMMFTETLTTARRLGFEFCEASWVLEDNRPVHQLAEISRGRIVQVFRIYDRAL